MLICSRDVLCRAADFEKRAEMLSLRPWQWDILFALDGRTPLIDVVRGTGVETSVASEALQTFHEQGLITVRTMRLEEYTRSAASFALPPPAAPKVSPPPLSPLSPAGEARTTPAAAVPSAPLPPPPMPAMPRMESVSPPPAGGVIFSLKPPNPSQASIPNPASAPDEKNPSSPGSIGFKIK